jgi:hypothetical protein
MALTKQQLEALNEQSFPNNNSGEITAADLRTYNQEVIDNTVNQTVYTTDSASFDARISAGGLDIPGLVSSSAQTVANIEGQTIDPSVININNSGSITADDDNVYIVAPAGNGIQLQTNSPNPDGITIQPNGDTSIFGRLALQDIPNDPTQDNVAVISSGNILGYRSLGSITGSYATTGSNTFDGDQNIIGEVTASRLRVESNTHLDGTLRVTNDTTINGDVRIQSATPNLKLRDTSGGGFSSGYDLRVDTGSFEIYDDTHDRDVLSDFFNQATSKHTTSLTSDIIIISGSDSVTIQGQLTASLQEGYAWVGNSSGVIQQVATSSFGGGGTIDTGSFATTGSNQFIGDQGITGSLSVLGVSGSGNNPLDVKSGYNDGDRVSIGFFQGDFSQAEVQFVAQNSVFQSTGNLNFTTRLTGGNNNLTFDSQTININASGSVVSNTPILTVANPANTIRPGLNTQYGGAVGLFDTATNNEINLILKSEEWGYPNNWTGPSISGNNPSDEYPAFIGFQQKSNWTDGRVTILKPLDVSGSLNVEDTALFNNDTTVNGITTLNGNTIVNGNLLQELQSGFATLYLQNPNFFSEYYGNSLVWNPNSGIGGNSILTVAEKSEAVIQTNAFSGAYDSALTIKTTETGTIFADWDLPSYGDNVWLSVPDQGTPQMVRGLDVGTSGSSDPLGVYGGLILRSGSGISTDGAFGPAVPFDSPIQLFGGLQFNGSGVTTDMDVTGSLRVTNILQTDLFEPLNDTKINVSSSLTLVDGNLDFGGSNQGVFNPNGFIEAGELIANQSILTDYIDPFDLTEVTVRSKLSVTETLKLAPLDPLPTGVVGELAVSGSNLYFHNGTSWGQIN